jgi:DNA modification methylase
MSTYKRNGGDLFVEDSGQLRLHGKSVEEQVTEERRVECLGMTFESDAVRREYFTERLREKLRDPEFRKIEGFPKGEDADILQLSDPPYYTACPNPFIEDAVKFYGRPETSGEQKREPYTADISEGKNHPIYNAHAYHTKVPHKAIMRYVLHYTEPGDIILDGFCGTGMTGVAALLCGDSRSVAELGYKVTSKGNVIDDEEGIISKLGTRYAVLCDLSPAATFIAYNYNTSLDVNQFEYVANEIIREVDSKYGWVYLTLHGPTPEQLKTAIAAMSSARNESFTPPHELPFGKINFTVWSDVFTCSECAREVVFWEVAVDHDTGKADDQFQCQSCQALLTKRTASRVWVTKFDENIGAPVRQAKQVPVLVNYSFGNKRYEKPPDEFDLKLIEKIEAVKIPYWFPTDVIPEGFNTDQPKASHGITHVHHFYTKRNLLVLAYIMQLLRAVDPKYLSWFTSTLTWVGKENRLHLGNYFGKGGGVITSLRGTWYIASLSVETSVIERFILRKRGQGYRSQLSEGKVFIETLSSSNLSLPPDSCDYIFTDPPFGGNLMYSELNIVWEAWLQVFTNNKSEAIENRVQKKGLFEYQQLIARCFADYYRVLKPGRWMTVEFHNSKNSVWNAIQEAIQHSGFVVADVRTLDKGKGSFKQVNSASAVKQDLIISAYKPSTDLEKQFVLQAGTTEGAWEFIRAHLRQLPVFVPKDGRAETIAERMSYMLFDRMVAFHVQRGISVPMSAAEFYAGLTQRFPLRDEMYFLHDQVAEYDQKRMTVKEVLQLEFFVNDEASARQWLTQQLTQKPQTFQQLHSQFLREIGGWKKHERPLELLDILESNFLSDDAGRWYLPDPNKASDLERLRERELLKEFDQYRESKQKKLKVFRLEAVRAGFQRAWQQRDYPTIIEVARKVPEEVLQEDQKLLMWYDQAVTRLGHVQ